MHVALPLELFRLPPKPPPGSATTAATAPGASVAAPAAAPAGANGCNAGAPVTNCAKRPAPEPISSWPPADPPAKRPANGATESPGSPNGGPTAPLWQQVAAPTEAQAGASGAAPAPWQQGATPMEAAGTSPAPWQQAAMQPQPQYAACGVAAPHPGGSTGGGTPWQHPPQAPAQAQPLPPNAAQDSNAVPAHGPLPHIPHCASVSVVALAAPGQHSPQQPLAGQAEALQQGYHAQSAQHSLAAHTGQPFGPQPQFGPPTPWGAAHPAAPRPLPPWHSPHASDHRMPMPHPAQPQHLQQPPPQPQQGPWQTHAAQRPASHTPQPRPPLQRPPRPQHQRPHAKQPHPVVATARQAGSRAPVRPSPTARLAATAAGGTAAAILSGRAPAAAGKGPTRSAAPRTAAQGSTPAAAAAAAAAQTPIGPPKFAARPAAATSMPMPGAPPAAAAAPMTLKEWVERTERPQEAAALAGNCAAPPPLLPGD